LSYFKEFRGNLDKIDWWINPDEKSRVKEYLENKVDVTWNVRSKGIPAEVPSDEVHYTSNSLTFGYVALNLGRPPLDDIRARKALGHAIDRRLLLEEAFGRKTPQVRGGVIPPGMAAHSPELGLKHDIELARQYLSEAGYPAGRNFPALKYFAPDNPVTDELFRQWAEALGIEIEILVRSSFEDSYIESEIHGLGGAWVADYPDPDSLLSPLILSNLHQWGWHNARFDDLVDRATCTPNRTQRLEMYREADRILVAEDVVILPLLYGGTGEFPDLIKPWLKKLRSNALGYVRWNDIIIDSH
jgi:ABC-type oligopeptide transport system substrate-binding subunit